MYRELLLGCGYRRERLVDPYTWSDNFAVATAHVRDEVGWERWQHVVTVDRNPDCAPDYVMDLAGDWRLRSNYLVPLEHEELWDPLPYRRFKDAIFDEVHAYEVLEHLGQQGDEVAFFRHFESIWRVLKVGGFLCATVPSRYSPWLWGDPGHRRAILPVTLYFLRQTHYRYQVGRGPSSDYRSIYAGNFHIVHSADNEETHTFVLQALPPEPER